MKRLDLLAFALALCVAAISTAAAAEERKVLKLAFTKAETSLDPARIVDLYSRNLTAHIFEALYQYDHLARPSKIKPLTADGMPEVSADFKVWTVKVKPGIYFADDPASFARSARWSRRITSTFALRRPGQQGAGGPRSRATVPRLGRAARRGSKKPPFDYDREIEGIRALDRYTIQFGRRAAPRFKS
jgi:ABC-type transport system substrate-binding protein